MNRTANVKRFEGGWQVNLFQRKDLKHVLYVYSRQDYEVDLSFNVALGRAEMWIRDGLVLPFPLVVGRVVDVGTIDSGENK